MCACQLCLHSLPMSAGFEIKNAGKNQLWWVTPSNHEPVWRYLSCLLTLLGKFEQDKSAQIYCTD